MKAKQLEQLLRDAHREGFHKAREVAKANYHGPYHRSFFDWSKAREAGGGLMAQESATCKDFLHVGKGE